MSKMAEESLTVRASYWPSLGAWSDTLLDKPEDSDYSQTEEKFKLVVEHTKHQVGNSGLTWAIGEEGLTVTLMALLFANARWAAGIKAGSGIDQLQWCQYSKNGQGPHAESESGADFAVIIESPNSTKWRLGIFQAKRASVTPNGWKFSRGFAIDQKFEPLDDKNQLKRIQFVDLVQNSACLQYVATGRTPPVNELNWVHYLGYVECGAGYSLVHHPVSALAALYQSIQMAIDSLCRKQPIASPISGTVAVTGSACWFEHLCAGWSLPEGDPDLNWLEFDPANEELIALLPEAFETSTVSIIAQPESARKILDLLQTQKPRSSSKATGQQKQSKSPTKP
ncbi:hypothetical protein ACXIUT_25610 [Achromobacter denitrificans]|uniref:hypothetical protein n=1 Tax=Achromobacter sp. 2789STDY5608633 TaxID=1806501 RepID=UPI0018D1ED01|nr:hypothetical protein [Achromobacter sp. 2789STDY5608633]